MKTNIKLFTLAVFAFVSLLFVTASMAQTSTTGELTGTVSDTNGAAVAGADITINGPSLLGSRTTKSDSDGTYRFQAVPPGKYTLEVASSSGFGSYKQENITVNLSSTATQNIELRAAGVGGVVDVVATSDVDTTNNTTGTNVTSDQFSNFPTGRTVQSLYTIAPTVARSGLRDASGRDRDPSVAGSSGPENNYILDGVTTTDPAFGGSGANLPFEFVQEIEIKTGAYGAEYGKSTGGIFNVITKSGGNEFRGDLFGYFTTEGLVREIKTTAIPKTGAAPSGFSEVDAGVDIGGPIVKDKLSFFAAFNPQVRKNFSLTQTFLAPVENKITTPFYAGKLTWNVNNSNVFTFSTFGDFTKQEGHLFGFSGFGANINSFRGRNETGGSNYAARLNSTFSNNFTGEFSFGLHLQRANTIPELDETAIADRFSVLRNGAVLPVITPTIAICGEGQPVRDANGTIIVPATPAGPCVAGTFQGVQLSYVEGTGGTVQRNFVRQGFGTGGLKSRQDRNRWETAARLQNIWGRHTLKYGFEFTRNMYSIDTRQTGGNFNFTAENPAGPYRIENRFAVCSRTSTTTITCPSGLRTRNVQALIAAGQAPVGVTTAVTGTISVNPTNPFLLLDVVRARSFSLNTQGGDTKTDTTSFYFQDDFKVTPNFQVNMGARWDLQKAYSVNGVRYLGNSKLTNLWDTLQPRLGFIYDFTGKGRGKIFANYARFVETPIPLDVNVRASGGAIQNDFNLNLTRLNGAAGSTCLDNQAQAGCFGNFGNLGNVASPAVNGLKPQTVNEYTAGIEFQAGRDMTFGMRGIYRPQGSVIEDGSFDDGHFYFLFNPGESSIVEIAELVRAQYISEGVNAPEDPQAIYDRIVNGGDVFGRARRYYRALEFTATKRFSNNYQFIASYVFSSLIGNYEGLFRNDNGQADPNITSLFDLPSLLDGLYGRLPNDRPHQFKFNGTYQTPFKLMISGNFYAQSGIPFNALVPHPLYGDNEGFCIPGLSCVPRGTATNPLTGSSRTPTTFNLDMGAYYPWKISENKELRFTADWFNVTNTQRAVREDETFLINSGAAGIPPGPNPFYGTGTIFQFPSHLRFGAKFSF
ncbi:MAG: TonB-dependent receptor domain-containing protein [Pyrinomonadaceae bacterium]